MKLILELTRLYLLLLFTLVAGCATLSADGRKVQLTENISDTKSCKFLKTIATKPPYVLANDWKIQLKNQAALLGGNVVHAYFKSFTTSIKGEVYLCERPSP